MNMKKTDNGYDNKPETIIYLMHHTLTFIYFF